jgi:hypothetical protein
LAFTLTLLLVIGAFVVLLLLSTRPLSSFELTTSAIASDNDSRPLSLSGTSTQAAYFAQQTATRLVTTPNTPTSITPLISVEEAAMMTATAVRQLQTQVAQWTDTPTPIPLSGTPPTVAPCSFNWATKDVPELTAEIQSAIDDAGLESVTVIASAYGENCYANDTNEVQYFATMQTNFHITVVVDALEDEEVLGNLTAQILTVLNQIPPEDIPGPQPGNITLAFVAGDAQRKLYFSITQADTALEQGLTGAALFHQLNAQQ